MCFTFTNCQTEANRTQAKEMTDGPENKTKSSLMRSTILILLLCNNI